ncbi:MAG: hypothetical protein BGO78_05445 [Chloroflexi bacterium 44-23]|nr:MAG: hypothetical protein BGO78_05445 [Chloroflexi bacterium 44-23]
MSHCVYDHPVWVVDTAKQMHPGGNTLTHQALAACQFDRHDRALDLGCGSGNSLKLLSEMFELTCGVDLSRSLLCTAQLQESNAYLSQAQAEALPFKNASMDAILCECTLSLFAVDEALTECARVLRASGMLIISDLYIRNTAGQTALQALPGKTCLSRAMPQSQIEAQVQQAGMKILHWSDYSQALRSFPVCNLISATGVDPFDLQIAAARAKLSYFLLIAQKEG